MNNQEVAQVFANIGDLLEIKGEVIYKILAYRRAAETLREYNRDINAVWKEGRLRDIPSVGQAIADKIDELLNTGQLGMYERLKAEVPFDFRFNSGDMLGLSQFEHRLGVVSHRAVRIHCNGHWPHSQKSKGDRVPRRHAGGTQSTRNQQGERSPRAPRAVAKQRAEFRCL